MGVNSRRRPVLSGALFALAAWGCLSCGWADSFHGSRFSQVPAGQTGVMRGSVQQNATPVYPVAPCPQGVYPTFGVPYGGVPYGAYGVPVYPTTTQTLQVPVQGGGTFTYSTTSPGYYGSPLYGGVSPYGGGAIYGGSTTRFQGSFSQRRF